MKRIFWNGVELSTPVEVLAALYDYRRQRDEAQRQQADALFANCTCDGVTICSACVRQSHRPPTVLELRVELERNGSLPEDGDDPIADAITRELTR